MAKKRRRKRRTFGENLKYEVYGILLITVSVIALSGEATVGRSLTKLFALVLGKFHFALALVGIAAGLYVMVTRMWPKGWTYRRTGFLLLLMALTLMSSIGEIDRKLAPADLVSGSAIFAQLGQDIRDGLLTDGTEADPGGPIGASVSGGYLGALQYSLLYTLFGYFGSKLLLIVMFAISAMLITGRSYVELGRVVRDRLGRLAKLLQAKAAGRPRKPKAPKRPPEPAPGRQPRPPPGRIIWATGSTPTERTTTSAARSPRRRPRAARSSFPGAAARTRASRKVLPAKRTRSG